VVVATFNSIPLETEGALGSGAILYLQRPAGETLELEVPSRCVARSVNGSRAIVILGTGQADRTAALQEALDAAQVALDIWAIKGAMARTLDDAEEKHVLWWSTPDGSIARIWTSTSLSIRMKAKLEVRDGDGNLVPPPPRRPDPWHPSFRFFRLEQSTTDLVDAFRNCYLALESLLSTIEPVRVRPDGRRSARTSSTRRGSRVVSTRRAH
jgi:hypothetical protein